MIPSWWSQAEAELHDVLSNFTFDLQKRLDNPKQILFRSNPFLIRSRSQGDAQDVALSMISSYLNKSAQTIFGNKIEEIAIVICTHAKSGRKSGIRNMDLEYDSKNTRNVVSIKSSENWGNSSQKAKLRDDFLNASVVIRQNPDQNARCIEGCAYGKSKTKDKGSHITVVGHDFWLEISGWSETIYRVMQVIGDHASNGLMDVQHAAASRIVDYLAEAGVVTRQSKVDWSKLLDFVLTRTKY